MQFQLILAAILWIHGRIRQEQRDKKKGSVADWIGESCLAWNGPISPRITNNPGISDGQPHMGAIQILKTTCCRGTSDWQEMFPWVHEAILPLGSYQLVTEHCEGWKLAHPAHCGTLPKVTLAWGHPTGLAKTQSEMHCNLILPVPFFFPLSFHRGQIYLRPIPVLFPFTAVFYQ